jgi:hypothetical protein
VQEEFQRAVGEATHYHRTMSFPHSIAGHWRQRHLRALMARTLADEHEIFVLSAISCQPGILRGRRDADIHNV